MVIAMTLVYEDLYNNIIAENAEKHSKLRIITGYSSGNFVNRVLSDFPNLSIEMYVGMALQGVSQRDHDLYRKISDNGMGEIYYVDRLPMVHQKILEFYDGQEAQNIGFVGSANFSYSGFMKQREVMASIDEPLNDLFGLVRKQSGLCLSNTLRNIPFMNSYDTFKLFKSSGTELNDIRDLDESEGEYSFRHILAADPEYKEIESDERYTDFLESFKKYEHRKSLMNGAQKDNPSGRASSYCGFLIKVLVNYKHYFKELPTDLRDSDVAKRIEILMEFSSFKEVNKEKKHFYSAAINAYKDYLQYVQNL